MKKQNTFLDFKIDKLTNSIENTVSGDSFQTEITLLTKYDIKTVSIRDRWIFDWKFELEQNDREVYKLTIINNPNIIQGLLSLSIKLDHIYIHLLESSPFNKGKLKLYRGVPGNLIAFACKISFQRGYQGFVSFHAKTKLINHYVKTLGAINVGNQLMIIDTKAAQNLIDIYFKS